MALSWSATLERMTEPEQPQHVPVLRDRVVALLAGHLPATARGVLVDATLGAGGHAAALLAAAPPGVSLVGIDQDPDALALAGERLAPHGDRVHLVHARFDALAEVVRPVLDRAGPLLGVLYDLGVSSMQLDRGERGFSFRADAPLDMRMDPTRGQTAADLVNSADAAALARVLRDALPAALRHRSGRTSDPATRTFQALRIAVNDELPAFRASLPQALELAPPGDGLGRPTEPVPGRVAVLAYHSLEDRIAKRVFADAARGCVCPPDLPVCACGREPLVRPLTRGAETPDADEVARNPRARSARLRAVEVLRAAPPPPDRR